VTAFWYFIVAIGLLATVINFGLAAGRRDRPLYAAVRLLAGVVSLAVSGGVVLSKLALGLHLPSSILGTDPKAFVIIATGLFIGGTLMLPAYIERGGGDQQGPTLQQRASRPANASVRLERDSDQWVN
jgi:hypothetical protein